MSDGSVHHMDSIEIDDDGSQGLPRPVNDGSAPSIPQAKDARDHGGTSQNKYMNFFSCMNEKSDIDIGLNEVVAFKTKQCSYGSKDYLHNLKLSTAPLDPKFHFISSHDRETDSRNQASLYPRSLC